MGWYYPQPQPTQLAPHVVQASTGQNPPIKVLAATAAAILTLWPVGYDHSAYGQNYRPKQTAPFTLVYGAQPPATSFASLYARRAQWAETSWTLPQGIQHTAPLSLVYGQAPPVVSCASLYAQRSSWSEVTWSSPQSAPEAAIIPRVDNPPLIAASPVFVKDPARPIYGLTWQYGTQNAKGDFSGWSAPPPAQAPPVIGTSAPDALASWSNPTWPAQDLSGPLVQPYPGDEPPGVTSSATDLAAFGYYDGWPSQRLSFATTAIPPPVVSPYLPPAVFPYAAILAWQAAPTWSVQSEPDVQPLAAIAYGSQPPPNSIAAFAELRASWVDSSWTAQSAGFSAAIAPGPIVSAPTPRSVAAQFAARANWVEPTWSAQGQPLLGVPPSGPAPTIVPSGLPTIWSVLSCWPAITWNAQSAQTLASLVYGAQPTTPNSIASQVAIRSTWAYATWSAQSLANVATNGQSSTQPPVNSYAAYAARLTWSESTWGTQRLPVLTTPAPFVLMLPPGELITVTFDDRRIYPVRVS